MTTLTKVEQAILDLVASYPGEEVSGRELRGLLSNRGFRRSAPAFVFTMMALADKGLIECREEVDAIVRSRGQKQAMFKARRQVADGARDLRVDGVFLAGRRGSVVRLIKNE